MNGKENNLEDEEKEKEMTSEKTEEQRKTKC